MTPARFAKIKEETVTYTNYKSITSMVRQAHQPQLRNHALADAHTLANRLIDSSKHPKEAPQKHLEHAEKQVLHTKRHLEHTKLRV